MRTQTPDEMGWYWCEAGDGWLMAFVDTGRERVLTWEGENPGRSWSAPLDDAAEEFGIERWHGPFACPGGDFGETTIVPDVDLHKKAAAEKLAIVLLYANYQHCGGHSERVTVASLRSKDEAMSLIRGEIN